MGGKKVNVKLAWIGPLTKEFLVITAGLCRWKKDYIAKST